MTDKQKAICELGRAGKTVKAITEQLGCANSFVRKTLDKYGIQITKGDYKRTVPRKPRPHPVEDKIMELIGKNLGAAGIAQLLGIERSYVSCVLKKRNISERRNAFNDGRITEQGCRYISGYKNTKSRITVACVKCGHEFRICYHSFFDYDCLERCPKCKEQKNREHEMERNALNEAAKALRAKEAKAKQEERALKREQANAEKATALLVEGYKLYTCQNCGQEFCKAVTGMRSKMYCSKECRARYIDRFKRDTRIKRIRSKAHDSDITLEKLYKRDNGVCYLCGCKCSWDDAQTMNGAFVVGITYPTVEHVQALANGGTHTWSNIKLACWQCNTKKGYKHAPLCKKA